MLQGEASQADWSMLRGWANPKRRRGREDVLGKETDGDQAAGEQKPAGNDEGDGDMSSKLQQAEQRAAEAESRAKAAEQMLASVRTEEPTDDIIPETPSLEQVVAQ